MTYYGQFDSIRVQHNLLVDGTSVLTGATTITGALTQTGAVAMASTLLVGSTLTVGVSGTGADMQLYGDNAGSDFLWDQNGDTNGSLTLGATTKSVDFRVYGATAATYLHWDGSVDDLLLVGTASRISVAGTDETSSGSTGAIHTAGGIGAAKKVFVGTDLLMAGGDINMNVATTGVYDIVLTTNQADALSIKDSAADIIVFETTTGTPVVAITPNTTVAGTLGVTGTLTMSKSLCTSNVGAANTGVTAVEYGDGYNHVTVLTVSQTDALTLGDDENLADGYLLYTLPAGAVVVDYTYMSMAITAASPQLVNDTPDVGIGTTIATGAHIVLGDVAGYEDLLTGQAADDCNGTAEVITLIPTAGSPHVIATGGDHVVHFNAAATWSNDTSADLTADIAGTVVLVWRFIA